MIKRLHKRLFSLKIRTIKPPLRLALVVIIFLCLCFFKNSYAYPFLSAENYLVLDDPRQSVAADFNGDGYEDMAVVNYRVSKVSILLNSGNGTFLPAVNYDAIGDGTNSIAAADFDNLDFDNNPNTGVDLAVSNYMTNTIDILVNDGSGVFTPGASYTAGSGLTGIIATDLNSDTFYDLVVADSYNNTLPNYSPDYISVLLNNGAGSFLPAVDYAVSNTPIQIVSADFDGDADNDLVISFSQNYPFSVLENNGDGTFMAAVNFSSVIRSIVSGDFNGDGKIDLAGVNIIPGDGSSTLIIIKNDGVGSIHFTAQAPNYAVGNFSNGIVVGDFNYDAIPDLAVAGYIDNTVTIFEGNGDFTFSSPNPDIDTLQGPYYLMTSDFDNDNKLDLVSINKYENIAYIGLLNSYSGNSVSLYRSGVIITPVNGELLVFEGGISNTYSVVLGSQPSNDVVITPATADGQTTVLPSPLTFTSLNWNTPQVVNVTAVDDVNVEGVHTAIITHTATSLDLNYNAKGMPQLSVTVADNDSAGVIVNQSGGVTPGYTQVREGVITGDSFSLVLENAPASNVVVTIGHSSQISLSSSLLTFTNLDWATPQIVTITAPNDKMIEGTVQENIVFNADSLDLLYDGLAINPIEVNILDANILKDNPLCAGRTGDLNNDKYFDSIDRFYASQITLAKRELNSCSELDGDGIMGPGDIALLTNYIKDNNNLANNFEIILDQSGGSTDISEDGTADNYVVYLRQQPSVDVGVTIGLIADGQVLTNLDHVTFSRLNYYVPQTIVVSAVDDFYVEVSPHVGTIVHTAYSADPNYNSPAAVFMVDGVATPNVVANITDNDTAGVVVTQTPPPVGTTDVDETTMSSDTIDFSLTSSPSFPNTVEIVFSTPDGQTTVSPSSIIFTPDNPGPPIIPGNWNVPQTITITAVDDSIYEGGAHIGKLWGTMTSVDPNYNGVGSLDINITESPPPDPMPSLSINNISIVEGNSGDFTVTLSAIAGVQVTVLYDIVAVTATVADNDYVDFPQNILIFNPGESTQQITVAVNDDTNVEANEIFYINLSSPVNAIISDAQGVGTISDDAAVGGSGTNCGDSVPENPTDAILPDLPCVATSPNAIDWNFEDNAICETGYKLFDVESGVAVKTVEIPNISSINETGLVVNSQYSRYIKAYNSAGESAPTSVAYCYTLAKVPNQPIILSKTDNELVLQIDPNDGNPIGTQYLIKETNLNEYIQPDGTFGSTEVWQTYEAWGGDGGIQVIGDLSAQEPYTEQPYNEDPYLNENVNAALYIALTSGQDYNFSVQARNGDGIPTGFSATTSTGDTVPGAGLFPIVTAAKGVGINLALNKSSIFANVAQATGGLVSDSGTTKTESLLREFSLILNLLILILLGFWLVSIIGSLKYFGKDLNWQKKLKLFSQMFVKEPAVMFSENAQPDTDGIYQISFEKHKQNQLNSQKYVKRAMGLIGIKAVILVTLLTGLAGVNHLGKAQSAPYDQNGIKVNVNDTLSYIIEINNSGTAAANNTVIIDTIDSSLGDFKVTDISNCGVYTDKSTSAVLNIDGADVVANSSCVITYTVKVKAGSEGKLITNQALVLGSDFATVTTNTTSNQVNDAAIPVCGNNIIETGEQCDPVGCGIGLTCVNCLCQPILPSAVCGNGIKETGEQCDPIGCSADQTCTNCICQSNINTNINTNTNEIPPIPPIPPITPPTTPPITPPNGPGGINQPILPSDIPIISALLNPIFNLILDPINTILENKQVEQVSQDVITPMLLAVAALTIIPAILATSIFVLPYLHLIFLEPFLLLFGKKRKKWGIVYNSLSKVPVDLALVRLYSQADNRLIQTRVTDKEGRYLFVVSDPGKYYISVTKPGFSYPTKYLKDEKQDTKYLDLYHGEALDVTEKNAVITANIPLDLAEQKVLPIKEVITSYFVKNLRLVVSYIGMILALLIVLIYPTVITIGALMVHITLFLIFRRLQVPPKPKSWGIIYDSNTKEPLGQSVVRIFDLKFNKLLETQITDKKGRYSFLVGKNEYQLLSEKEGYKPKEVKPVDLVKNEQVINMDVGLSKS